MLTAQLAKSMDDEHLLASARAEIDTLTSTALELELLERFERLLDERNGDINEAIGEFDFEAEDINALGDALILDTSNTVALLKVIGEAGFDNPELLKAALELDAKFHALANDAGDFFTRLNDLLTTNQE